MVTRAISRTCFACSSERARRHAPMRTSRCAPRYAHEYSLLRCDAVFPVQLGKLALQRVELRQVVEHDVRLRAMRREIILMIRLRLPELRERSDLRHDRVAKRFR